MKRPTMILGVGILLLLILTVAVSGDRVVSDNKVPSESKSKNRPVESTTAITADSSQSPPQPARLVTAPSLPGQINEANADYHLYWWSINSGGDLEAKSDNYKIGLSTGQSVIGEAIGQVYVAKLGFWYCDCGVWGDVNNDGNINPQDVIFIQQAVFFQNDMMVQPPNCLYEVGDVNCSGGSPNPVDVIFMQQYVYFTNDMFCPDPCGP